MGFMHALRDNGLPADPAGAIDLCSGLREIDLANPADFQAAARTTLMYRKEDLPRFDDVFREYWLGQRRPRNRLSEDEDSEVQGPDAQQAPDEQQEEDSGPEKDDRQATYGTEQILRRKDLALLTDADIELLARYYSRLEGLETTVKD